MNEFTNQAAEASPEYSDDAPNSTVAAHVHRALRDEAVANDARSGTVMPVALLWQALTGGVCRVVDTFFTSTRCYVVVADLGPHACPPIQGRRLEVVERLLSGTGQKVVALDLGVAPSTVAHDARLGLRSMGVLSQPSRIHPLLMLAAKSARERDLNVLGTSSLVFPNGVPLRAMAIPRPDPSALEQLSGAESAVVHNLVEGRAYARIARERGTSPRTIANQVAASYRRLKVSGRNELVHRLFAENRSRVRLPPAATLSTPDWGQRQLAAS